MRRPAWNPSARVEGRLHAQFLDARRGGHAQVPGDPLFEPLVHAVEHDLAVPASLAAGPYALGLYLPDATGSADYRLAVRVANDDVPFWVSGGAYGVNVLGNVTVT